MRAWWQRRSNPGLSTETRSQPGDAARIWIPPLTFAAVAKAEAIPATETAMHDVQVSAMVPTTRAYEEALLAAEVAILADNLDRRYNAGKVMTTCDRSARQTRLSGGMVRYFHSDVVPGVRKPARSRLLTLSLGHSSVVGRVIVERRLAQGCPILEARAYD